MAESVPTAEDLNKRAQKVIKVLEAFHNRKLSLIPDAHEGGTTITLKDKEILSKEVIAELAYIFAALGMDVKL